MQLDAPLVAEKEPVSHGVHVGAPLADEKEPGSHGVQLVDPSAAA